MADLSIYAGRWIALTENDTVAAVGGTWDDARRIGHSTHPKERLRLFWISTHPPHIAIPDWPLRAIRDSLPADVWLVGGPVRDLLLARAPHDWDFAVPDHAMVLARTIADRLKAAYYPLDTERDTGRTVASHPVTRQPITLDFAALRGDTIEEDLYLRDFTINAMALNLKGELIDPLDGQRDLRAHLIRVTGEHTFENDPARLLRAVRQANSLDFHLEAGTATAIRSQATLIHQVSPERVQAELLSLIKNPNAAQGLELLAKVDLLQHTLPEIHTLQSVEQSWPHFWSDTWSHTLAALTAFEGILVLLKGKPIPSYIRHYTPAPAWAWTILEAALVSCQSTLLDYLKTPLGAGITHSDMIKWGALFHDAGKANTSTRDDDGLIHFYHHPETGAGMTQTRLEALHFPNRAIDFAGTLVKAHMRLISLRKDPPGRRALYRFYRDTGDAGVGVVLLALADTLAVWGPKLEKEHWRTLLHVAQTLWQTYFEKSDEIVAPSPFLNGHDLMAIGLEQGPAIGKVLEALREAQAAGEVMTREAAKAFVRQWQPEPK